MSGFYQEIYELSARASPQVALDLGILSGLLSAIDGSSEQTRQAAQASLLRIARLLVVDQSDTEQVDLDDAMDQEEDAAAANGQQL